MIRTAKEDKLLVADVLKRLFGDDPYIKEECCNGAQTISGTTLNKSTLGKAIKNVTIGTP